MAGINTSSGDVMADKRADYARMLAEAGDYAAAVELMEQALELKAEWAAGWSTLGDFAVKAGLEEKARSAFYTVLRLDGDGIFGARLKLALLKAETVPNQPPSRYVEALFDDYAARFDKALLEKLGYKVPEMLASLILAVPPGKAGFQHMVDLGCGTGLLGAVMKPHVAYMEGFDLSQAMLAKAESKGHYQFLAKADLSLGLEACGLFSNTHLPARADLVTAADVLMYLGALDGVFGLAYHLLCTEGLFAFSVEKAGDEQGFCLASSMRYQHSFAYIDRLLREAGFDLVTKEDATIRMDGGKPVSGMLFIARKRL